MDIEKLLACSQAHAKQAIPRWGGLEIVIANVLRCERPEKFGKGFESQRGLLSGSDGVVPDEQRENSVFDDTKKQEPLENHY